MRMYSNLLLGNGLVQRQQSPSMLNVACCDAAGCCSSEAVKEVVVFVSPTTTVGGSFVGAIGGGGGSLAVFGFMLVAVCTVSNERVANVVQAFGGVVRSEYRRPVKSPHA